jgi:glycosyltransferase involved in cell wall biosynthesis
MRAWKVDLIHAHDARSHALAMIALLGKNEMPLIVTRRVAFTPRSVKIKYGARVTRFIAISRAVKEAMTSAGIDGSRITIIHSGVTPKGSVRPRDWKNELGWPRDSVLCGVVGAMTTEKGTGMLQEIAAAMPADVQQRIRVVLIGGQATGPTELGPITAYSAGFITDIDAAVAGLDILMHPSRSEGLGTAVIDAMALGIPAVAFAVGGLPEVIDGEISGILVPPGDSEAFARQVARLASDPGLRSRLGDQAILKARAFDAARMTEETEAVYNDVLSG